MKAIVLTRFGSPDVLQLRDVPEPSPKDHEILIRIHATTASAGDCELRGLRIPLAFRIPIRIYVWSRRSNAVILGQELAGEIESIGRAVTRFRVGDQVFGWTGFGLGGYAEYTCLSERGVLATKPSNMTYEEAAPLAVGGLEAVHFLRSGDIQRGEKILIVGAGGSIGTFAVQLAKYFGANVTAVDRGEKLDMLRSIGADRVIDYMREDFTATEETYDVIFDVAGKASFPRTVRRLAPDGRYLMGNPPLSDRIRGRWMSRRTSRRVIPWRSRTSSEYARDLEFLKELVETGQVRSVIDRRIPLEQAAEAHRYVDTGQKRGNVVITVLRDAPPE